MKDNWCSPLIYQGKTIFGGAARNVRIARRGGMDNILKKVVAAALEEANEAVAAANRASWRIIHKKVS